MTHTYALLGISFQAYDEIRLKLIKLGYGHTIKDGSIDMNGLALCIGVVEDHNHMIAHDGTTHYEPCEDHMNAHLHKDGTIHYEYPCEEKE